jgi:hypothetical protein
MPPALFGLAVFQSVLCFCLSLASDGNPPAYASSVAGITDMHHRHDLPHLHYLLGRGSCFFFAQADLEL